MLGDCFFSQSVKFETTMEVQFKKHVRVICDLKKGDVVYTEGWGYELDRKDWVIDEIKEAIGKCESGFMVKLNGYDRFIDSTWLNKR